VARVVTFLASGAYTGYIPVAPGTFGSALAVPLAVALAGLGLPPVGHVVLIAVLSALAMVVCDRAERDLGHDSRIIVLDEICGMLVATAFLAPTPWVLGAAFLFFRAFDVLKPFPCNLLDRRMPGGAGIVSDDLVAGLYANLLVRVLT
jgi:phosphatidylglycerophosphatase A